MIAGVIGDRRIVQLHPKIGRCTGNSKNSEQLVRNVGLVRMLSK